MRMEDESKLKVIPVRIEAYFRQEHYEFKEICENNGDNESPLLPVELFLCRWYLFSFVELAARRKRIRMYAHNSS